MAPRTPPAPAAGADPARSPGQAREQFLTEGVGEAGLAGIRAEIEASWIRSRQLAVDTDRVEPFYVERLDHETLLARSAAPILESLRGELAGEPIGILVTDAHGTVLDRQCPDPDMERRLDEARLAPGFVFSESSVGTNGIGVALEVRQPTMVVGGEHYVESLKRFGCAGAPVLHPITGAFMGVIDFTASAPYVNPLLLTFARSTAKRVQDRLLMETSAREVALMRDYLSACHHTGGSVLAVSADLVMMNVHAQQHHDPADQAALLAGIADVTGAPDALSLTVTLPSGAMARMDYRPAFSGGRLVGGVVRVQPTSPSERPLRAAALPVLPGVVGRSAVWRQTGQSVLASRGSGEWVVLSGEPGVGRGLLARAAQRALAPQRSLVVLDAGHLAVEDLARLGPEVDLLLEHVDRLAPTMTDALTARLTGERPGWTALTLDGSRPVAGLDVLLSLFPRTIEVPPLRHHLDDLALLVDHLLPRPGHGAGLTVSAAALNRLRRLPWPGNVEQLRQVLLQVTQRRRSGEIGVEDLPAQTRSGSRHQLTPLESLERDAIVAALDAASGSKDAAAAALGLSRASVYRKIKAYGILT